MKSFFQRTGRFLTRAGITLASASFFILSPTQVSLAAPPDPALQKFEKHLKAITPDTTIIKVRPFSLHAALQSADPQAPLKERETALINAMSDTLRNAAHMQGFSSESSIEAAEALKQSPSSMIGLVNFARHGYRPPYVVPVNASDSHKTVIWIEGAHASLKEKVSSFKDQVAALTGLQIVSAFISEEAAHKLLAAVEAHEAGHIKDQAFYNALTQFPDTVEEAATRRQALEITADTNATKDIAAFLDKRADQQEGLEQLVELRFLNAIRLTGQAEQNYYTIGYELAQKVADTHPTSTAARIKYMPLPTAQAAYAGLTKTITEIISGEPSLQKAREADKNDVRPIMKALEIAVKQNALQTPAERQLANDTLKLFGSFVKRHKVPSSLAGLSGGPG